MLIKEVRFIQVTQEERKQRDSKWLCVMRLCFCKRGRPHVRCEATCSSQMFSFTVALQAEGGINFVCELYFFTSVN